MTHPSDPFAHHPELRGQIADPETSFFRTFDVEALLQAHPHLTDLRDWVYSDAEREAIRRDALAGHDGDLWIFGYGSLMWDPALRFVELRRARLEGYARRLILLDDKGGRGTKEAPGLMAALDDGPGCDGLAFRIAAADVEIETEILFRREMIGPGYLPILHPVALADQTVSALVFVADHSEAVILGDICRDRQLRYLATGSGLLGTSRDYLASIVDHFCQFGIEDAHCSALLREVDARIAATTAEDATP
ncbi:gamma-glutamylcyclotransferase [Dinoroseobacter sp. S375]|uniref:gamma-glutamylcyclotransferase n=1 Tax=Dinoroseobacter sp. S375 TaxID=3415136 RepID=UPI003C798D65